MILETVEKPKHQWGVQVGEFIRREATNPSAALGTKGALPVSQCRSSRYTGTSAGTQGPADGGKPAGAPERRAPLVRGGIDKLIHGAAGSRPLNARRPEGGKNELEIQRSLIA